MLTVLLITAIWCATAIPSSIATAKPSGQGLIDLLLDYMEARYPLYDRTADLLYVSIHRQTMYHVREKKLVHTYTVATATKGPGCERDSYCTPTGLHRICSKHGDDVPELGILRDREFAGHLADPDFAGVDKDWITSRILWLEGLEQGVNLGGDVDSRDRMIYIHGTANERSLGTPSSMGCIRMRNNDIIALYDLVPVGTLVVILDN